MNTRLTALRDAASGERVRSRTRWEIDHDAGSLHITVTRPMYVPTESFIPGVTSYQLWTTVSVYTTITAADAAAFATATAATHIAITYAKPLTVSWLLPDGTTISGAELNQTVPAGTTVALCDDWRYTSINMHDTSIVSCEYKLFPPSLGAIKSHNMRGNVGDLPDDNGAAFYPQRSFRRGSIRIKGTPNRPSPVSATIADIQRKLCPIWHGYIDIQYAPNVTGDLAGITSWQLQPGYIIQDSTLERLYAPTYTFDANGNPTSTIGRWASPSTTYFSFHHCGVHGRPYGNKPMPFSVINDFTYYACPNARPEDFDGLIACIMDYWWNAWNPVETPIARVSVDFEGTVWVSGNTTMTFSQSYAPNSRLIGWSLEPGGKIIPYGGTLTISNRTADAAERATRVAQLRTAGWTVTEVDDSQEVGIYATV